MNIVRFIAHRSSLIAPIERFAERQALQFLGRERITLNPDCSFSPGSGAAVTLDEAYRKLCNEVEAARI